MSTENLSRRKWLLGAAVGAGGTAAARLAGSYGLLPPDATGLWAPGHGLTYAAHRLLGKDALAREFPREQISRPPWQNGKPPKLAAYVASQEKSFADWKLVVDGMVARPMTFTLADLRGMEMRSQITHLACEEGWSFIAEWNGVPLSHVLRLVQPEKAARYVMYFSIQPNWWDSVDMDEALHPQTILALGLNGAELPTGHGGPLRMRVPRQLGYKSVKYVTKLTLTDDLRKFGEGKGSFAASRGYAWYNGI
jgi:DMSO/TMAO reductase YedYZ molybdopterin-dependent catalytic subunit